MPQLISIQGYEGSFHQLAAQSFFGRDIEVLPCATFREVVQAASERKVDAAVMAIENSIAGSILANYALLQKSRLQVAGEVYLQIHQHLLANPGVTLDDLREVHSHPMALQQCLPYLEQFKWKLVETEDTALSAKLLQQHKSKHIAAIAGSPAAALYDLNILARSVQSEKKNYTRFLVLKQQAPGEEGNKASISFQTDHSKGSLAKVLARIAKSNINLSKLQSMPVPGDTWKYRFHADLEFDAVKQFHKVVEALKSMTTQVRVFGIYRKGKTINS
jgi:prephenate dehydratase